MSIKGNKIFKIPEFFFSSKTAKSKQTDPLVLFCTKLSRLRIPEKKKGPVSQVIAALPFILSLVALFVAILAWGVVSVGTENCSSDVVCSKEIYAFNSSSLLWTSQIDLKMTQSALQQCKDAKEACLGVLLPLNTIESNQTVQVLEQLDRMCSIKQLDEISEIFSNYPHVKNSRTIQLLNTEDADPLVQSFYRCSGSSSEVGRKVQTYFEKLTQLWQRLVDLEASWNDHENHRLVLQECRDKYAGKKCKAIYFGTWIVTQYELN